MQGRSGAAPPVPSTGVVTGPLPPATALLRRRPRHSSHAPSPQRRRDMPRSNAAPLAATSLARHLALAVPAATTFAAPPSPSHGNFTDAVPLEPQPQDHAKIHFVSTCKERYKQA